MKIFFSRHGQTRLNHEHLMQGHMDEPLNDVGRQQAREMRELLQQRYPGLHFDAVYSSPLYRAVETAGILSGLSEEEIQKDERIIEVSFGKYEGKKYSKLGPAMTLYWALPELFPAPATVEPISSMTARSSSFLNDILKRKEQTVLVVCHGGILRSLYGFMEGRRNGIVWRPKPKNCEIRVYEADERGRHLLEKLQK